MDEPYLLERLYAPIEHAFDLEFLDHRAAEDKARFLLDELGCNVGCNRRARNQRHAGFLHDRRKCEDITARYGANNERNLVALHQPLDQGNRFLRIRFVVVDDKFNLALPSGGIILERELHPLQITFSKVDDGRWPAQPMTTPTLTASCAHAAKDHVVANIAVAKIRLRTIGFSLDISFRFPN